MRLVAPHVSIVHAFRKDDELGPVGGGLAYAPENSIEILLFPIHERESLNSSDFEFGHIDLGR